MIEFTNVHKHYGGNQNVLRDINLTCEDGGITVLIGPSGCGKTTTMKLINRLINPSQGSILINGKDIKGIDPVELRRGIGYVIQHIGLFPHMTISRNVGVVPHLLKWDKTKTDARVEELLDLVGLDPALYKGRYPSELSGGQQQRIGVIRALAAEPEIILMDEPFSALDPISREQLQEEISQLQKVIKKTIVFVTHDMDEALKIADRIVLMQGGEIIQDASPEEILRRPANEFVKNFIGEKRLQKAMDMPVVAEVMVKRPAMILPYRGLAVAMNMMRQKQVDSLVVVDDYSHVKGYISIYDVTKAFDDEDKQVEDILQPLPHEISPDTVLSDGIRMLDEGTFSYIPVVNPDGLLAGLLTRGSIVGHVRHVYAQKDEAI